MVQVEELSVAVAKVAVGAAMTGNVAGVIGVRHGESLEDSELKESASTSWQPIC